jgi:predicted dehydrogenase
MIHVGIAGIGFMGMIHYLAYQRLAKARVSAIYEQDPGRLAGDWRSIRGNFGPKGGLMDLEGVLRYTTLEEMLADPQLDLIDICLPPAWHARASMAALKAGKHVFCEKPIALRTTDADRLLKVARHSGRYLMVGHVLPFFPEYRFAYQTIATGKYGRLLGGNLQRVISDPRWIPDFYDPKTTGGPMLDLHVHDAHFIRLLCGMPRSVRTVGRMRGTVAEWFQTQFLFEDPSPVVTATSGVIPQQGRPFMHAYELYLERATLLFEQATMGKQPTTVMPVTVLTDAGRVLRPKLSAADPVDAFVAELNEVVRALRSQTPSPLLDGQLARDALWLCQCQTQSLASRRAVRV